MLTENDKKFNQLVQKIRSYDRKDTTVFELIALVEEMQTDYIITKILEYGSGHFADDFEGWESLVEWIKEEIEDEGHDQED